MACSILAAAGLLLTPAPATAAESAPAAAAESAAVEPLWKALPRPRGLSFGGRLFTSVQPDLAMKGPYEDRFAWRSGIDFGVKYRFAVDARFALGARFRYELRHGDRTEHDAWFDLGEAYLQVRKGRFSLRVGRVLLTWGRNALFSPLNQLNPLDFDVGLQPGGEAEARIPVLALRVGLNLYPVALEGIWIPLYQPARVSYYGRDFSLLRPGLLEETLPGLVPSTGLGLVDDALRGVGDRAVEALVGLDPYARDGLQTYLVPSLPEEAIWNSDLGFRIGVTGRGVDFDAVVLWHVLDRPELLLHESLRAPLVEGRLPDSGELTRLTNPGEELIVARYPRSLLAGADVSVAAGGFVISGEAAFESTRVVYDSSLRPARTPVVRYAVGLRYNFGTVFAIAAEFGHDILVRPAVGAFLARPHDLQTALVATLRLFRDQLQVTLSASYAVMQQDLYLHPRVVVELDDHLRVTFGVQIFEGFRPDVEPSLASLLSYQGGLIGWFRGNDCAYGTLDYRF